ncbi:hypothetical protein Godav_003321 [Gossypium davidsonii]|uniref:TFIIS N-terminal domain-containing protein n=1 Tax=Gossypium davidsonii TaxID=34287 RepID=A0A7J8SHC6_GOSDV|nr:hypothetical protein [Gossypium davidsonii]
MTLEDFFTLTEMKDGLTSPSRVEELLTVMKKEKDVVGKNVSDVTRQWTAVASTIAATENKDCLDLFVQLDGLCFLDGWLKDAQDCGNESSGNFVEESITALLRALEKLHRNNERSISSEIRITVKNLLGHNSPRVQDGARLLFDNLKQDKVADGDIDTGGHDYGISDSAKITVENSGPESSVRGGPSGANAHEEIDGTDAAKVENLPSNLDGVQSESDKDFHIESTNDQLESNINSDNANLENRSQSHMASSFMPNPIQEKSSMKEEPLATTVEETASVEVCSLPESKQEHVEVSDAQKLNGLPIDEYQKLDMTVSSSSTSEHVLVSSGVLVRSAQEAIAEPNLQNESEANKSDVLKFVAIGDDKVPVSEPKKAMDDSGVMNHLGNGSQQFKATGKGSEPHLGKWSSSENEFKYRKPGNLDTIFSRTELTGAADEGKENYGMEDSRRGVNYVSPDVINRRMSDMELEYGIVDALEVARQVAQEVEREVVDDREASCSSSEKISGGGIEQPSTPDSLNAKQDLPAQVIPSGVSTGHNQSTEAYNEGEGCVISSDNADNEKENGLHHMESSQVTVAQEPEPNTKCLCEFDLNQEICSDDVEQTVNSISTPVSVVSASRAAAALGFPVAPLQFEGALGWKGSAATSAFRPASACRNSDGEKTLSLGGTSSSTKQRMDCIDFDLNVAEAGDEKGAELMSGKQVSALSSLISIESSLEVSPRKSKRLKLDLNCINDDVDASSLDSRVEGRFFYNMNGHHNPSPALSSSSMQPSMRNIDLNDRPYSHNDASEQRPYHGICSQNVNAYGGGPKPNDPVISLMGTRVEVNRKDSIPQVVSLLHGKAFEPARDANITRTGGFLGLSPNMPYSHSPAFSYNGVAMAPTISFSSAIYGASGSIPYMVDSRDSRATVVPQTMGSTYAVPPAYTQPQFIMGMNNTNVGLNGLVPSRPNFDLNSGLAIEGGNRDFMSLRQPFMPVEHLSVNTQPSSSSGVGAKREGTR